MSLFLVLISTKNRIHKSKCLFDFFTKTSRSHVKLNMAQQNVFPVYICFFPGDHVSLNTSLSTSWLKLKTWKLSLIPVLSSFPTFSVSLCSGTCHAHFQPRTFAGGILCLECLPFDLHLPGSRYSDVSLMSPHTEAFDKQLSLPWKIKIVFLSGADGNELTRPLSVALCQEARL